MSDVFDYSSPFDGNFQFFNTLPQMSLHTASGFNKPHDPPSREDWEEFKTAIINQYVGMNSPLHQIVRDMDSWYGFKATQRMYKQRFTDWGVFKYRKAADKRMAKAGLANVGSDYGSVVGVAMTRVPSMETCASVPSSTSDEAEKWSIWNGIHHRACEQAAECSHRRCIQAFWRQLEHHYTSTTGLGQHKLSQSPLYNSPKRTGSVKQVLQCVRQFSETSIDPKAEAHPGHIANAAAKAAQITAGIVGHCSHRQSPKQCERCTWAEFDFGLAMLEDQHTDLALASFELGCRLAHLLLSSPSKLFIRNLIMAFGSRRWKMFEEFRQIQLEYLARMASVVLPSEHPITIILDNVACGDTLAASAEPALRIMLEVFEGGTHPAHPDVLLIKRSLSVILRRQNEHFAGESIILSAIDDSRRYNGNDCKETRRCLRRLGHLYMEQLRYGEAEEVFRKILDTAPGKTSYNEAWIPDEISVYTYQHLARLAIEMGDRGNCRFWFMKELHAAIKRWGVGGEYTAECLQLAYNGIPPDCLRQAVHQYPDILNQANMMNMKGGIVISKARWCAVRNLI